MNATATPSARVGHSASRTVNLARFNMKLMVRNRTTMIYGLVIPLLPLLLLFTVKGAPDATAASMLTTAWLMALIFPVYYNLLSMVVSRRDELVLKRLRTGEVRDLELITSMALPGAAIALAVTLVTVPVAMVAGLRFPLNPVLLLVAVVAAVVTFSAFSLWTASWTKTAEAAQLTSAPVMVLALAGTFIAIVPDSVARWLALTPGAAVNELIAVAWFGLESTNAETSTLSFLETFAAALPGLAVLAGWTVLAVWLARRSMQWEPRA